MKDPRPWILVLAGTCFLAGAAAGVLYSRVALFEPDRSPYADYAALMTEEFELSDERAGHLRALLRSYHEEQKDIEAAHQAKYYDALRPELEALGTEYNRRIRDRLLPVHQRERFDALAAGLPAPKP